MGFSMFARLMVLCVVMVMMGFLGIAEAATAILEWTDPVPTAGQGVPTGHKIYRSTDAVLCANAAAPLPLYQTISTLTTTSTDAAVPDVTGTVCYEVTAFNVGGESERSNRASKATVENPPPAPALVVR